MRPQKIIFGDMREMGVRGVLVYCADYHCGHSVALNADCWPDETRLSDIEPRLQGVRKAWRRRAARIQLGPVFSSCDGKSEYDSLKPRTCRPSAVSGAVGRRSLG